MTRPVISRRSERSITGVPMLDIHTFPQPETHEVILHYNFVGISFYFTILSSASRVGSGEDCPDVGGEVGRRGRPVQPQLAVAGRPPEADGVILSESEVVSSHAR